MVPSVFYNPDDEADVKAGFTPQGILPSPALKRARAVIAAAIIVQRETPKKSDRARMLRMCEHVMGLRLPTSRLATLWEYCRNDALAVRQAGTYSEPSAVPGAEKGEYMAGAWLATRACLSLLIDVTPCTERDASAYLDIAMSSDGLLPPVQQRKAARIAHRYIAARIAGKPFEGGAQ